MTYGLDGLAGENLQVVESAGNTLFFVGVRARFDLFTLDADTQSGTPEPASAAFAGQEARITEVVRRRF